MAGAAALKSAEAWLRTAWTAGGNASKIKAASKAFLQMIGNIAMAVASAAGAKASAVKTGKLATTPITGKSNPAMGRQGSSRNNQGGATSQNNPANLIPMSGLDPKTYNAPKNIQDSYLTNNY